ncbi:MAG: Cyclic pyranopterin monophosphate synthase [Elusimicrobia bacterium]|nr:Cyclic pyranopterin monophosphate synthase [Elusimicrobiota bacterium]
MSSFSHLDSKGQLSMVDVSEKDVTRREAVAGGEIRMNPDVIEQIKAWKIAKGNVLETARLAGIMAAKKVDQLIPLCHSVPLEGIGVDFDVKQDRILIRATVRCSGKTGVEMEALTAATVAGLTIYDMCKAVDKGMTVGPFVLKRKSGGRSGLYERAECDPS